LNPSAFEFPDHVNFDNLMSVREAGEQYIDGAAQPVFDLSGLANASSAAAAVMVAWFRYAHVHGKVVQFDHVPTGLMNIIEVTELADVLPVKSEAGEASS
jgi:ABC-type transporter Mla MlaB component